MSVVVVRGGKQALPTVMDGIVLAFDPFGTSGRRLIRKVSPRKTVAEGLAQDWNAVGRTFRAAIVAYDLETGTARELSTTEA